MEISIFWPHVICHLKVLSIWTSLRFCCLLKDYDDCHPVKLLSFDRILSLYIHVDIFCEVSLKIGRVGKGEMTLCLAFFVPQKWVCFVCDLFCRLWVYRSN